MAVIAIRATHTNFVCLSTDTKPMVGVLEGATLQYLNTGECWIFDGTKWIEDLSIIYAVNQALKG